ncbi:MAG: magnesium chelatase domain-containing protein, partial [Planctomycetota bacterium]
MLTKCTSAAVFGIDAYLVEVEVDVHPGESRPVVVGLPDAAVRESVDRVKTAMINSRYTWPFTMAVLINLAPADTRKEGPAFDLPMALGIIRSSGQIDGDEQFDNFAAVGELALDGSLRPVKGVLSMAIECRKQGLQGLVVPYENRNEAAIAEGLDVIPVRTLSDAVGFFSGDKPIGPHRVDVAALFERDGTYEVDYIDVKGQSHAKRAMVVAAAG